MCARIYTEESKEIATIKDVRQGEAFKFLVVVDMQ